jgi:methyltransferase (TIGR00027 family)
MTGPVSQVGRTAFAVSACRGVISERPDAWFDDPLGRYLAGDPERVAQLSPQLIGWVALRTRFLDELVLAAIADRPDSQIVIPAAGLDIRAHRLALGDTPVYEIDRHDVLHAKAGLLAQIGLADPPRRHVVEHDLADPAWPDALAAAGHDPDRPTVWVVEGLLVYLDQPDRLELLSTLTDLSAPGSVLGVTMDSRNRPGGHPLWRPFPDTPPARWLAESGWQADVLGVGEAAARYGRPLSPERAAQTTAVLVSAVPA